MGHVCWCCIKSQQEQIRAAPGWLWKPNPQQPPSANRISWKVTSMAPRRHNVFYTDFCDVVSSSASLISFLSQSPFRSSVSQSTTTNWRRGELVLTSAGWGWRSFPPRWGNNGAPVFLKKWLGEHRQRQAGQKWKKMSWEIIGGDEKEEEEEGCGWWRLNGGSRVATDLLKRLHAWSASANTGNM